MKSLLSLIIGLFLFLFIVSPSHAAGEIVVLDAGHGGSDSGAVYKGLEEEDVTLDLAFRTRDLLVAQGYTVYLTRESDIGLGNSERAQFANSKNANILVSIHLNASTNNSVNYTQGFYGKKNKDYKLTQVVHNSLAQSLGIADNGITNYASGVLLKANMPATMQETVFISNDVENAKLQDGTGVRQQEIAQSLATGIINFFASR